VTVAPTLMLVWALSALLMTFGWLWQRRRRNAGIVDVLWACGLAGSALLCAALGTGACAPRLLLGACGALWGLRLAWHLWRRVRREPEDGRYQALRARWHEDERKWFGMFQFQAALIALFSVPFVIVAENPATRPAWLTAGVALWCLSVAGEARADCELARFRADPANRGRTCRAGLWRYSRHPNYFFEWLHWFTYAALAVGAPRSWAALAGPLVMFLFLRFVSGIPFTEAQALRTRGEDYRDYQRRTSMLFPWPPRRRAPQPRPSGDPKS
jgi:steroid 5-alpha reductase family enzyme